VRYNYAAMHQRKILVVEDEQSILELISYNLTREASRSCVRRTAMPA